MEVADDDMGEFWRDLKAISQQRRAENRETSAAILKSEGIQFEEKNLGAHLIVQGQSELIDFWPGTGKWITRKSGKTSRGVRKLIQFIRGAER